MLVEVLASGIGIGEWRFDLTGTYDSATAAVQGQVAGSSQGGIGGRSNSASAAHRSCIAAPWCIESTLPRLT